MSVSALNAVSLPAPAVTQLVDSTEPTVSGSGFSALLSATLSDTGMPAPADAPASLADSAAATASLVTALAGSGSVPTEPVHVELTQVESSADDSHAAACCMVWSLIPAALAETNVTVGANVTAEAGVTEAGPDPKRPTVFAESAVASPVTASPVTASPRAAWPVPQDPIFPMPLLNAHLAQTLSGLREQAVPAVMPDPGSSSGSPPGPSGEAMPSTAPQTALLDKPVVQDAAHGGGVVKDPLSFAQANWQGELGTRVLWQVNQGIGRAELRLDPPHLGPLEVRVSLDNDTATVTFVSAQAEVRTALESALPRLKEMFAEQGLALGNVNVSAQRDPPRDTTGSTPQFTPPDGSDAAPGTPGEVRTLRLMTGSGLVDVYA